MMKLQPRLDASNIGGIVHIDYLGFTGPESCTDIAIYGGRGFRENVLQRLKEQGYKPRKMPDWLGKHYIGRPTISCGSLEEGIRRVEDLDSKSVLQTDPKEVGIGCGILLEMQQYAGVEKPVAVLTEQWAD